MDVKLEQHAAMPSRRQADATNHWIFVFPTPGFEHYLNGVPYGDLMRRRHASLPAARLERAPIGIDLPNGFASHISFACLPQDLSRFELLTIARRLVAAELNFEPKEMGLCVCGFEQPSCERVAEALIAAVLAAVAPMPRYKSSKTTPRTFERLRLFGFRAGHHFQRSYAEAEGNNLARYLTGLPPNALTPAIYRRRVASLAKSERWRMEFLDQKELRRMRAGAFLAVAQGSPEADAGIIHLEYRPSGARRARSVALVGKGICFDTGGVNLKPPNFMLGMHKDMQGSAVALGTLLALTRLEVGFPVQCWMALAANHIGPRAYKPNDVVRAADGTTIEVINSDAEGRMVLADTLTLASRTEPRLIIDFATLTGACKRALGNGYSGVFTNQDGYVPTLIDAGRECGERLWPFPLDADYDQALESAVADIKQCAEEAAADHILAARFLQRFVKAGVPWIHIDLSSGTHKGGLAHVPTDITGFGVRLALHLLLDRGFAEERSPCANGDKGGAYPETRKGTVRRQRRVLGGSTRSRRVKA